nr:hypothetical protein [Myxococcus xanthus]
MAALLFRHADVSSHADVIAYAVSAGCIECLFLGLSALQSPNPTGPVVEQWAARARKSRWIRNAMLVERVIAVAGHLGSRGLVGIPLLTGTLWPTLFTVASFSLTDGWRTWAMSVTGTGTPPGPSGCSMADARPSRRRS